MKTTSTFFRFINYCNIELSNDNEFAIVKTIMEMLAEGNILSLEDFALKASISPASISRFIRKMGYDNYQEFRHSFLSSITELNLSRQLSNAKIQVTPGLSLQEQIFNDSIRNLQVTLQNLDTLKLNHILKVMLESNTVIFVGSDLALNSFFRVQLDLIARHIPAYLWKNPDAVQVQLKQIEKNDCIVLLDDSIKRSEILETTIKQVHLLECNKILLTQDRNVNYDEYTEVLLYGDESTSIYGIDSLFALSHLFSYLINFI